ncbi:hypothetical protein KR009_000336 [Drosophila setifemur]|nr:hypothetical protein KR009_000336 [Drosophila setifemur]
MHIPEVDMWTVSKCSRLQRNYMFKADIPGLKTIDYNAIKGIDMFYLECQDYRDYFKDPYNKVHLPERFRTYVGKCGVKLDTQGQTLMVPSLGRVDRQPIFYPVDYKSDMALGRRDCDFIRPRCARTSSLCFKQ